MPKKALGSGVLRPSRSARHLALAENQRHVLAYNSNGRASARAVAWIAQRECLIDGTHQDHSYLP